MILRSTTLSVCLLLFSLRALSHQSPTTLVLLSVKEHGVAAELQIPLNELVLAVPFNLLWGVETIDPAMEAQLKSYLLDHVHPESEGTPWEVLVNQLAFVKQTDGGETYLEFIAHLWMVPPAGVSPRTFTFNYDLIIHELGTHTAIVSVKQDWDAGVHGEHPMTIGVIARNDATNTIAPLEVTLDAGSKWIGFMSMVGLGTQHISEGTDHLLLLLVLLLPATLVSASGKWSAFAGVRNSLRKLVTIVTAFTVGHSVTLLIGTLGWVQVASQPVEVLIAFSIFISAIHAISPIFPGKESWIAAGFGLIHGLAFATILQELNLDPSRLALSLLGFNIGIELMQLVVVLATLPALFLCSLTPYYHWIRVPLSVLAGLAAIAWMTERLTGSGNVVTDTIPLLAEHALTLLVVLTLMAGIAYRVSKSGIKNA